MGRYPKKFLKKILIAVIILISIMTSLVNPITFNNHSGGTVAAQELQNYDFPDLGTSTEEVNDEVYDEAGILQKAGVALNIIQVETHKDFPKPILGFSLSADEKYDITRINFIATNKDGSKTPLLIIEKEEMPAGEEIISMPQVFSKLYTFEKGIIAIDFYHTNDVKFEIIEFYFDGTTNSVSPSYGNLQIEPEAGETYFASDAAEKTYIKNLFGNLGVTIKTRDEWGAPTKSNWDPPDIYKVNRVIVHHTATSTGGSNPEPIILAIYNYHAITLGWLDIGYNYIIDVNGNIYEGRGGGNGVKGAHAGSTVAMHGQEAGQNANFGSAGIAILGDYSSQTPSQASIQALAKLIGAVSTINDFDPAWHNNSSLYDTATDPGVYAHRDVLYTACPGNKFYSILPSISSSAQAYKDGRSDWIDHLDKIQALSDNKNYMKDAGLAKIVLRTENVPDLIKEKLLTNSRGVSSVDELSDKIIYTAEEDKVQKLVSESLLVDENTKAQPDYIYRIESWDNSDPDRAIPSDYDASTHWNLENIKAPEGWKNLGGCDGDTNCLGSSDVVVAVLDTGVAYEDYNYDAGTTFLPIKIGGLYHEVPQDSNPDGQYNEGYDREYTDISSLAHVTYVLPYDFAQDFLCDLRSTSPGKECTATEITKKSHPGDDHGHGTAVSSIIAAQTADAAPDKIAGIASNVKIMPVKVFLPNDTSMCQDQYGNLDLTCADEDYDYRSVSTSSILAESIDYAVDNGANIINLSLGGPAPDYLVEDAVERAYSYGVIVVAAAGNNGANAAYYSPANIEEAITVGAVDQNNDRSLYSNYGSVVDVVAPVGNSSSYGAPVHTYACYTDHTCSDETDSNLFKTFSSSTTPHKPTGTSFAVPQVVGALSLALSKMPTLTPIQASQLLKITTSSLIQSYTFYTGYGVIDIGYIIDYLDYVLSDTNPNTNPSADGDDMTDIIAYHRPTTKIDVTPSTGSDFGGGSGGAEIWNSTTYYDSNWQILKPADVNGDGNLDIVAYNKNTSAVSVTISNNSNFGKGLGNAISWNTKTFYGSTWTMLNPADVNGDGKADLIAYHPSTTKVDVTLSDGLTFGGGYAGAEVWNSITYYDSHWRLLDPSDVNGDGYADLIAFHPATTKIDVTLSDGSNFGGGSGGAQVWNSITYYGSDWTLLDPADVNNDGMVDIIAFHPATTKIDVTPSTGTNFGGGSAGAEVWNSRSSYSADVWQLLSPADVDNDGAADIIAFNKSTTQIDVTLSNGVDNFGGGYRNYQVWNTKSYYSTKDWTILNR